jgi:N-acyl-D-aspartate/D-glutamate deacylase
MRDLLYVVLLERLALEEVDGRDVGLVRRTCTASRGRTVTTRFSVKCCASVRLRPRPRGGRASANGARVLGFDDAGVIAPGKLADLAIFELPHRRYFGLHDPLLGPAARRRATSSLAVASSSTMAIPGPISKRCATTRRAS